MDRFANGSRVHLAADGLDISHVFGNAIGAVVANKGGHRIVDTVTTVGLELRDATPMTLGSSMLRVEGLALEAGRMMGR